MKYIKNLRFDLQILCISILICTSIYWYKIVYGYPIDFWGIAWDSPVMSLSHAINIDFWLNQNGSRLIGVAQTYHPGFLYQIISYLVYILVYIGSNFDNVDRLRDVLTDPKRYWDVIQVVPLFATNLALLIFIYLNRKNNILLIILSLLTLISLNVASRFLFFDFFNESLVLIHSVIYFSYVFKYLDEVYYKSNKLRYSVILGFLGGVLYLLKMNYILWAFPVYMCFGIIISHNYSYKKIIFLNLFVSLVVTALTILTLSFFMLGKNGMLRMFGDHLKLIIASGRYGNGKHNIVDYSEGIFAIKSILSGEPLFAIIFILIFVGLLIKLIINLRNNSPKTEIYKGFILIFALLITLVAVIKHYVPYYLISTVAIFPFAVLYVYKDLCLRRINFLFSVLIIILSTQSFTLISNQFLGRKAEFEKAKNSSEDADFIRNNFPLKSGEMRFWIYRVTTPEFQRNFILEFSSLPQIENEVMLIQRGAEYEFSPWHDYTLIDGKQESISKIKWKYLVIDRDSSNWINKDIHGYWYNSNIRKIELKKLVLYIND
jgi:hypothetical protein